MATLTKMQLAYLAHHNVDISETIDASGLSPAEWKLRLKLEGKLVAYGTTPCRNGGHTLRTTSDCIQCRSKAIAFARRSRRAGFVYLAYSSKIDRYKIGFSESDPDNRIYIANCEGYGGAHDWKIRLTVPSMRAGKIEEASHQFLKGCHRPQEWVRNGIVETAREIFDCDLSQAIEALMEYLDFDEIRAIRYR